MEILRIPSNTIQAVVSVTTAEISYEYTVTDLLDSSNTTGSVTSSSDAKVTIPLPSKYDGSYRVKVDDTEHYVDVVRPYVDPTTKGETASEIATYAKSEELARGLIDSVIIQGFYFKKKVIETTGLGSDYIPLWVDAKRLLKIYENNILIYDLAAPELYPYAFAISDDKTSVIQSTTQLVNRLEGAPLIIPASGSDIVDIKYTYKGFPRTFDYRLVLEVGYPNIPSDLIRAAELLADDHACGKLEYFERYISSYNTDQFKLGFDDMVFEGTGNIIVDKILSKYAKSITTLGVL
jgi:hypothetical protein